MSRTLGFKSLFLSILSLSLILLSSVLSSVARAEIQGADQIARDIEAGRFDLTWTVELTDSSVTCEIAAAPVGAFSITTLGGGRFEIRVIDRSLLRTNLGVVRRPTFHLVGCGGGTANARRALSVTFQSGGQSIDIERIQVEAENVRISAHPARAVRDQRVRGFQVSYKRNPGFGRTAVEISLSFEYEGEEYLYTAMLPTVNDGWEEVRQENVPVTISNIETARPIHLQGPVYQHVADAQQALQVLVQEQMQRYSCTQSRGISQVDVQNTILASLRAASRNGIENRTYRNETLEVDQWAPPRGASWTLSTDSGNGRCLRNRNGAGWYCFDWISVLCQKTVRASYSIMASPEEG